MSFNFEEFTQRNTPASSKQMRVSLHRKGNFSLSQAAYEALGKPKSVVLLYDREKRAIGFKPVQGEVRHAYTVRGQKNTKSYLVGAIAFCQHYDIDTSKTRTFEPQMADKVLVIELAKAIDIAPRVRRNGKAAKEPQLAFS
jgi:hypothetical protein